MDAFLGTKGGSPRVVSDETKLAITDSATLGCTVRSILTMVTHFFLL
jgi:hypothetical protein